MTITSATLAGRVAAERNMLDTCTVKTVVSVTPDPLSGQDVVVYSDPVYTGRCKVQTFEPQERNPEAGGASLTVQRYAVHVPVGAFVPGVGQVVTITTAALDPNLTGRAFRVVALLHKTAATAYRLSVEES